MTLFSSGYPVSERTISRQVIPSLFTLPRNNHIEQLFKSVEPLVLRDRVDGSADDEGAFVLIAVLHLDPERDLPRSGSDDPQGALGAVSHSKLPGAFEQDSVPAEIADNRCHRFPFVHHRKQEVFPAGIWNFMPFLFPIIDLHAATASGNAAVPDASLPRSVCRYTRH